MAKNNPPTLKAGVSETLWNNLQFTNRPITVYRALVDVLGSVKTAVLLSQMLYWTKTGVDIEKNDGWFHKTMADFADETGLSVWEQETARHHLKEAGIIETKKTLVSGISTSWLRVNLDGLSRVMAKALQISAAPLNINDVRRSTDHFKLYLSKRLPYHTALAKIAGGVNAGLMLSCFIQSYFKGYNRRFDGFVTRSRDVWKEETGLSYKEQLVARRLLVRAGLISERHLTLSRHIDTSIDFEACLNKLITIIRKIPEKPHEYTVPENQKRASLYIEKGFSATGKRAHIATAKGFLPDWQKVSYLNGKTSHSVTAKPTIYNKEQITYSNYINKQQQKNLIPLQANLAEDEAEHVVVDSIEKIDLGKTEHLQELVFGKWFDEQERQIAKIMLHDIGFEQAQLVLDEISGRTSIRNPLGYLRKLCNAVRANTFVPEKAHRVRACREKSAKTAPPPFDVKTDAEAETEVLLKNPEEAKKRMERIKTILKDMPRLSG